MLNQSRLGRREAMMAPSCAGMNMSNKGANSQMTAAPTHVTNGPSCAWASTPICGASSAEPSGCARALTIVANPTTSSVFQGSRKNRPANIYMALISSRKGLESLTVAVSVRRAGVERESIFSWAYETKGQEAIAAFREGSVTARAATHYRQERRRTYLVS